jgi:hypothetical protein
LSWKDKVDRGVLPLFNLLDSLENNPPIVGLCEMSIEEEEVEEEEVGAENDSR